MTDLEELLLTIAIYLFSIILIICYKPFRRAAKIDGDDPMLWIMMLVCAPLVALFIIITSPFLIE